MAENSVKGLKDTLHAQQDLLQQLYTELDVEREAAATATDESLSMMIRLQGEKAAVEMEASQYKRIAEEKIGHAEETVATFRDLIYQKEMQIASLEFQVQAYKFKLISLGCTDVGECDPNYPENMFLRRGGQSVAEVSKRDRMRRGSSLPPNFLKDGEEPPTDGETSGDGCLESVPETRDLDLSHAKSGGDFTCYWEQIKKLDDRVKELSFSEDLPDSAHEINNSLSLQSQTSSSSFYDALRGEMTPSSDKVNPIKDPAIQDIFEVLHTPNINVGGLPSLRQSKEKENLSLEADLSPRKHDPMKIGIVGFMDKNKPRDGLGVDPFYFKRPDVHELEFQQMSRRLKSLEDERIMVRLDTPPRHEISVERDDDHMCVLKSIKDQLNSIEEEIMSWRTKKPTAEEQLDLTSLTEAMMLFSL